MSVQSEKRSRAALCLLSGSAVLVRVASGFPMRRIRNCEESGRSLAARDAARARPPKPGRTPRPVGFSLLETVLVAAIIAVVAAIAVPRYGESLARYRADLTARRIAADLKLAQVTARTSSTAQRVLFSIDEDLYQMPDMPGLDDPTAGYTVRISDEPYLATLVAVELAGDEEVVFDGWGMPDTGGSITIRAGNVKRTVWLDSETGKATAQ